MLWKDLYLILDKNLDSQTQKSIKKKQKDDFFIFFFVREIHCNTLQFIAIRKYSYKKPFIF